MDRETNAYETYENTATALSEVASPVKRKLDELDKQLGELGELTHILIQRISLARRAADSVSAKELDEKNTEPYSSELVARLNQLSKQTSLISSMVRDATKEVEL